jgi:hypothetical protein
VSLAEEDGEAGAVSGYVHNTDLEPGAAYLETLGAVAQVFTFEPVLNLFHAQDEQANRHRKRFTRLGAVSLALALAALVGSAIELLLPSFGYHLLWFVVVSLELCAISAIVIALGPAMRNARREWLIGRFLTERMRQWVFQMLLDGELVSKSESSAPSFEKIRDNRWTQFVAHVPTTEGVIPSFVDGARIASYHERTTYTTEEVSKKAFQAYVDLRFTKELAYFKLKHEEFASRDEWSEAVARWTLFSAVLLAAVHMGVALAGSMGMRSSHQYGLLCAACVILLTVISTATRTYRSAIAVSEQRQRYESKWVRLLALQSAFATAVGQSSQLAILSEVEEVLAEELREFLRQMRATSYVL